MLMPRSARYGRSSCETATSRTLAAQRAPRGPVLSASSGAGDGSSGGGGLLLIGDVTWAPLSWHFCLVVASRWLSLQVSSTDADWSSWQPSLHLASWPSVEPLSVECRLLDAVEGKWKVTNKQSDAFCINTASCV